jgi:catechol 2,3-dioxygenase-like lactoylglutathione lyase family enzyme
MSPIRPKKVAVFSLWAEDVPTAAHFYRDVVGLPLFPHAGHLLAFDLGDGCHLAIIKGQPVPARNSEPAHFPLIAFEVEDLKGAIEHLEAHGVELPWGVESGENASWVIFRDPAGNLIEFVQFDKSIHH